VSYNSRVRSILKVSNHSPYEQVHRIFVVVDCYRKQKKWVVNRFLRNPDRERLLLFGLDATDLASWKANVEDRAADIVSRFLADEPIQVPTMSLGDVVEKTPVDGNDARSKLKLTSKFDARLDKTRHHCDECERVFVGAVAWASHLRSRKHAKVVKSLKRKLEVDDSREVKITS
jgi:hypothetical protein